MTGACRRGGGSGRVGGRDGGGWAQDLGRRPPRPCARGRPAAARMRRDALPRTPPAAGGGGRRGPVRAAGGPGAAATSGGHGPSPGQPTRAGLCCCCCRGAEWVARSPLEDLTSTWPPCPGHAVGGPCGAPAPLERARQAAPGLQDGGWSPDV
ncbi:cuticle collagen 7-like [Penaeus japonicus]|uniref:cuticle collagen 7-like n=1 Tax=Penaeus japonicus TaxID=27405 RepID=UPI001C70F50C|nr:cuticle collagen 7-like [Penaeus japonicus]